MNYSSLLHNTTMELSPENRATALRDAINHCQLNPDASIRSVAGLFGVNRSTLSRHLIRPTSPVSGHEMSQRLSNLQERFLVDWIKEEDARGYAPSRSRVHEMAEKLLRAIAINEP